MALDEVLDATKKEVDATASAHKYDHQCLVYPTVRIYSYYSLLLSLFLDGWKVMETSFLLFQCFLPFVIMPYLQFLDTFVVSCLRGKGREHASCILFMCLYACHTEAAGCSKYFRLIFWAMGLMLQRSTDPFQRGRTLT